MRAAAAIQKTGCIEKVFNEAAMTPEEKFLVNFNRNCKKKKDFLDGKFSELMTCPPV